RLASHDPAHPHTHTHTHTQTHRHTLTHTHTHTHTHTQRPLDARDVDGHLSTLTCAARDVSRQLTEDSSGTERTSPVQRELLRYRLNSGDVPRPSALAACRVLPLRVCLSRRCCHAALC